MFCWCPILYFGGNRIDEDTTTHGQYHRSDHSRNTALKYCQNNTSLYIVVAIKYQLKWSDISETNPLPFNHRNKNLSIAIIVMLVISSSSPFIINISIVHLVDQQPGERQSRPREHFDNFSEG